MDPLKRREVLRITGKVRYLGVVIVLACWLVGFLTDIVGNGIHILLFVALVMTIFIYVAGRYDTRAQR